MSDPLPDDDPSRAASEMLLFARGRLGSACERLLDDPARQALVLSRLRDGYDLEDAVLAEVHRASGEERRVADEFVAYFLSDLMRMGHRVQNAGLQRFLDTGDLVQSILGDLWPELASVRFETRGRFLAYLGRRLNWKVTDRARALRSRREDRRVEGEPELLGVSAEAGPPEAAARREDNEHMALALLRLPERDRELLTMYLRAAPLREMAARLGLTYDAARMALQRALRRARRMS